MGMYRRGWLIGSLIAAFITIVARPAAADPVRLITSGEIKGVGSSDESATFSLIGTNLSLAGLAIDGLTFRCSPCAAGETVTPEFRLSEGQVSGSVDDVAFTNYKLGGFLVVAGGPVLIPSGGGNQTLSFPFSIVPGSFLTARQFDFSSNIFNLVLAGSGLGTLTLRQIPDPTGPRPIYTSTAPLAFTFDAPNPSPTPEPGTVLLTGSALAFLLRRRGTRV